jgi:hypothetical protein
VAAAYLRDLADYRRHEYDWRRAEASLNEWPQFTTTIDGATVHFAHLRSAEPDATPLIIADHHARLARLDRGVRPDRRTAQRSAAPTRLTRSTL